MIIFHTNKSFSGYIIIKPHSKEMFLIECCPGNSYVQITKVLVKIWYMQHVTFGVISAD